MQKDKAFQRAQKKFFNGEISDTSSVYRDNTAKFYGASDEVRKITVDNTIGNNFKDIQNSPSRQNVKEA
jgi:hypothetical protein